MEHKSETRVSGGKDVINRDILDRKSILQKMFEELNIEFRVKGYKSSEGDQTFDPPTEASPSNK